jgi:hypothetical protein
VTDDTAQVKYYRAMGFNFISLSADVVSLTCAVGKLLDDARALGA